MRQVPTTTEKRKHSKDLEVQSNEGNISYPHDPCNVGKYTLHGSYGLRKKDVLNAFYVNPAPFFCLEVMCFEIC